jgi:sulfur carrier protein
VTAVVINGEHRDLPADATIAVAVREAGAPDDGRGVAVALDGEVVPRGQWDRTPVRDGQQVEVLHAVQGGS